MMARGIRRGQRRAWFLASSCSPITVVAHVLRGGPSSRRWSPSVLAVLARDAASLLPGLDGPFDVRARLPRLGFIALVAVVAATIGIEVSSGRHHSRCRYGVVLMACIERFVGSQQHRPARSGSRLRGPGALAIGVSLFVSALYLVTRPVVDRRLSTITGLARERRLAELRAREIVRRHGRGTLDYFALRDDKQFFFFRDSLVAYAVYGGVALVSPDPIGPEAERTEAFSAFRAYAEGTGLDHRGHGRR